LVVSPYLFHVHLVAPVLRGVSLPCPLFDYSEHQIQHDSYERDLRYPKYISTVTVSKGFATLPTASKGISLFCVIGHGIHGSLNVLFTRVKHNNKLLKGHTTLIGLLTMCIEAKESPTPVASVK
jgi:hypothetical protein